ncbi:MAG: hypothetical protein IPK10_14400 [Bacteroidetes bacterium]|nr:hypothetical protein [Bacteroidota bacterium]
MSLQVYANHLQITYYVAITIGLLVFAEFMRAIQEKQIANFMKASVILALAAVLAILPNITNLLLTYEYGNYSTRGPSELTEKKMSTGLDKDYALGWSYGQLESMTLLIPDFAGGSSAYKLDNKSEAYKAVASNAGDAQARSFTQQAPLYWGDQPMTSGPVYSGAIAFFLFVLSMFLLKGTQRIWIASSFLLFLMLSWGKNFLPLTDIFFDHVPGYNKFRSVAMALTIASFMIPFGGMLGLMRFVSGEVDKAKLKKKFVVCFLHLWRIIVIICIAPWTLL